ncbi:MAG TPA: S8 family serine peptidase [Thermoanaerobaculia bacterium]|nr:S8 family serine peptidase [Thermoanaerobaculia bacterium]
MNHVTTDKLKLTAVQKALEYDPRLQAPTPTITSKIDGRCYVDVLAKLKNAGDQVPGLEVTGFRNGRAPDDRQIVTGRVAVDDIEAVREKVVSLKAATELHLSLYNSVPAIHCDPESLNRGARESDGPSFLGGAGVIVGVVDVGCDFRHGNFRQGNTTRIRYLWDQSTESDKVSAPRELGYGREFTEVEINEALRAGDERAYEVLGYTPPVAAHGTHVLDIAAGNGREPSLFGGKPDLAPALPSHPGIAPNAELIFVHLKTFDGNLANSNYLVEAVEYIFKKAQDLKMPAVVNVSLSTTGGPHDGSTLVEQKFERLLREPGRAIVVSAGNSFNQRSHVSGKIPEGGKTAILWHTDPRHTDPALMKNAMEVWYAGNQVLEATLYTPDGGNLGSIPLGETMNLSDDVTRCGRISHRKEDPNNQDHQIDVRLPTLEDPARPWRIELANLGAEEVSFHAWIEQDARGLSYFGEPTDSSFTLGSISCSEKTLTVGAYDTSEMACLAPPFEATSAGPTRPNRQGMSRNKPDLSAPGVNIVAARAHGGVTVMSGTSMAAAHVTGVVALLFELAQRAGRGRLSIDQIRNILNLEQEEHPIETLLADPEERKRRLGAGSIDGAAAMKSLLEKIPPLESTVTEDTLKALSLQILAMQETLSKLVNHGSASARE